MGKNRNARTTKATPPQAGEHVAVADTMPLPPEGLADIYHSELNEIARVVAGDSVAEIITQLKARPDHDGHHPVMKTYRNNLIAYFSQLP